jgi:CRP-like cAMP-binding protein
MDYSLDILARTELFRGLGQPALTAARAVSFRKQLKTGEDLLVQGSPADSLFVVVVGRLRVTQTGAEGQQVIVRYLGSGELAGYATLSGGGTHPGTATAVDDTHVIGWTAAAVRKLLSDHPAIAANALAVIGSRYRETQLRLREVATERVEQRIAHTILRLADQAGRRTANGIEITFPVSRQDLAEMCGTTLHTVSRTLSEWEDQGVVESGRRRVIVSRPDQLAAIANETADG